MNETDPDEKQERPSHDELQERAQDVWRRLKLFFAGVFLVSILVIWTVGYVLYHTFGVAGLVFEAFLVGVGLFLLCRHLLTY